jgi:low temperature requirement protein LtrA
MLRKPEFTRPTFLELVFDVVFVLVLTQLGHVLGDVNWTGVVHTLILLLALSNVWAVTAQECNTFDPRCRPIQLLVLGALLGTLVMAAAVPEAFGARGLYFAVVYIATQLGTAGGLMFLLRGDELQRPAIWRGFWFGVSAVAWIVGAFLQGWARGVLWALAVAVEYGAAVLRLPTPVLGRPPAAEFTYSAEHLADRCRQFFTIALGELILVTGLTLDQAGFQVAALAATLAAFATTVLLWRIYFYSAGEQETEALAAVPGPLNGRPVIYAHPFLVGAVLAISVSYKLEIADPLGRTPPAWVALFVGGPALFLAARALLEYAVFSRVSWDRPVAILVLAAVSPLMILMPPLLAGIVATLALAGVAAIDTARGPRTRPRPAEVG